jgi:hypothetical protein
MTRQNTVNQANAPRKNVGFWLSLKTEPAGGAAK